jgi:hypothetical protein
VADRNIRRAAVRVLGRQPNFAFLELLRDSNRRQSKKLLRWLDQAGIALLLQHQLQASHMLSQCPTEFQKALELRRQNNRGRMQQMLGEFERTNEALTKEGVVFCAVKGFTLYPEFCAEIFLRHQTDIDFLIATESKEKTAKVLNERGYFLQESAANGEMTFGTPLLHVPSHADDIYGLPQHRQVDLRTSLWSDKHGVSLRVPAGVIDRGNEAMRLGVRFRSLAMDDVFLLQVVHAFQHLLDSWVRLSWLYEIDFFLSHHAQDNELWESVKRRAGDDRKMREAVGLILLLTSKLFGSNLPAALNAWCVGPLNDGCKIWVNRFGMDWAIADFPGNSLPLLVQRYFMDEPKLWNRYLLRRLLPLHTNSSSKPSAQASWQVRAKGHILRVIRILPKTYWHLRNVIGPFIYYGGMTNSPRSSRELSVSHGNGGAYTSEI